MATDQATMRRRVEFLRAAASYAFSNLDDLNEALGTAFTEEEARPVLEQLDFALTGELPQGDEDVGGQLREAERELADAQELVRRRMQSPDVDRCPGCAKALLGQDYDGGRCTNCLTILTQKERP